MLWEISDKSPGDLVISKHHTTVISAEAVRLARGDLQLDISVPGSVGKLMYYGACYGRIG